jgi:BirA family biotin operon repressor/biotin-[acetyl-CoA-carboxylase] ligase
MSKLEVSDVRGRLAESALAKLDELEFFSSIASTNTYLMTRTAPAAGRFRVAIADHQTAGRGRHDRRWISTPGAGLCLSVSYTFASLPAQLPALTLAIGVGVVTALRQLAIEGVSLKWPNDLVALDGKLGGILTEAQSGGSGGASVVAGIGINVRNGEQLDLSAESGWAQRPIDLDALQAEPPAREMLAGTIVNELVSTFSRFEQEGFAPFAAEWRRHDWLHGKLITVEMPEQQLTGTAAGVDADGALLIDTRAGRTRVINGSIIVPST